MVFSSEDKILIKNLVLLKGYSSRRLIKEFPVTFRDATSWLRTYAERCLLRIVTVVSVTANFLLIYCDVYVCLVLNSGSFW